MPTIGEMANIDTKGLDQHKGKHQGVTTKSPPIDQVALTHGVLLGYAKAHGFEPYQHRGVDGFVGHVTLGQLILEAFDSETLDAERQKRFSAGITSRGSATGLFSCLDRSPGMSPTWWVAADYEQVMGYPPFSAEHKKKAATYRPGKRGGGGRKKGSRNRTRLELLELTERTLARLGRPVLTKELYQHADFPVSQGSVNDALNELERDKKVVRRLITEKDRDYLRSVGAPARLSDKTKVSMAVSAMDSKNDRIGTVTWQPPEEEKEVEKTESTTELVPEPESGSDITKSTSEDDAPVWDMVSNFDRKIANLGQEISDLHQKIEEKTEQQNKLTTARDGLLTALELLEEDE